jgi:formylglycine-generating enzyme required for sulfatase activity
MKFDPKERKWCDVRCDFAIPDETFAQRILPVRRYILPDDINVSRRRFIITGSSMALAGAYLTSCSQLLHAGNAQTSLSGLGFKMAPISGGTYRAGDIGDKGLDREEPVHTVTVNGFEMCATEVTVGQFRKFTEETGYKTEAERGDQAWVVSGGIWTPKPDANWKNPYIPQTDTHPVVCVSWNDALEFCAWLSKKTGQKIGLPTGAEWEYACRAGTETRYYTGNTESDLDRAGWYWRNSGDSHLSGDYILARLIENHCGTHPVGQKIPNAWGLCDMTGNVWEWCMDRVDKDYYTSKPSDNRVFRGGGWYERAEYLRIAYRHWRRPSHSYWGLGFRIVRRP